MAIIRLDRPRNEFFSQTPFARLRDEIGDIPETNVTADKLTPHIREGRLVPVGQHKTVARAMTASVDASQVLDTARHLHPDQVMLLPQQARIPSPRARRHTHHSSYSYINLMDTSTRRSLRGEHDVPSRLSFTDLQGVSPLELLDTALPTIRARVSSAPILGYRWDNQYVSWSQLILGAELRAHQNAVFWSAYETSPQLQKDHTPLQREQKIALSRVARERYGITEDVRSRLAEFIDDLVEVENPPHVSPRQGLRPSLAEYWRVLAPSVSGSERHNVRLDYVPAARAKSTRDVREASGMVFGVREKSDVASTQYSGRGTFWSGPSICALTTIVKIIDKREAVKVYDPRPTSEVGAFINTPLRIADSPFLVPTKPLMRAAHALRYRAVVVDNDPRSSFYRLRTLNQAEVDTYLGALLLERPAKFLWRSLRESKKEGLDVQRYVVEYKGI